MEIIKELNGKKYIVYCCDRCGKIVEGVHTCPPNPVIEQLRQRVQELEEERKENKQLQASFDAQCVSADKLFDECAELRQRVAELEKEAKQLRDLQYELMRSGALVAIEKCKNATGQRRVIDMYVSANQIAEDLLNAMDSGA